MSFTDLATVQATESAMAFTGPGYDLDLLAPIFRAVWRDALVQGIATEQHEAFELG